MVEVIEPPAQEESPLVMEEPIDLPDIPTTVEAESVFAEVFSEMKESSKLPETKESPVAVIESSSPKPTKKSSDLFSDFFKAVVVEKKPSTSVSIEKSIEELDRKVSRIVTKLYASKY